MTATSLGGRLEVKDRPLAEPKAQPGHSCHQHQYDNGDGITRGFIAIGTQVGVDGAEPSIASPSSASDVGNQQEPTVVSLRDGNVTRDAFRVEIERRLSQVEGEPIELPLVDAASLVRRPVNQQNPGAVSRSDANVPNEKKTEKKRTFCKKKNPNEKS